MRLQNKRVFVTAAGQGIGRAIASAAMAEGATVLASDLELAKLDGLACDRAALDVTEARAVAEAIPAFAPDTVFHCAGIVDHGAILEMSAESLSRSIDINIRGAVNVFQAALPGMLENGQGSLLAIASVASSIMGVPDRCAYGTTKAALIGLVKSVARDYIAQGVRCNCICPGTVDSPSLHERLEATGDYQAAMSAFVARQPMGRIGKAEEIAALAIHMASDAAAYMTGQAVVIDGGMSN